MFDDFIDHNELGLALHTICDSLLERERVMIEDGDIAAIGVLHERMQIKDECVEAIRQHREKRQEAL